MISAARILSISTLSFCLSNVGATVFTGQFENINFRKLSVRSGPNVKRYKTEKSKGLID